MSESKIIPADSNLVSESDYFKVAALELSDLYPVETKLIDGRIWFTYRREEAESVIRDFETGKLKASLRDYAASLTRTKTKIFSIERTMRAKNGNQHATAYR